MKIPASGESVKSSFRKILADSHVATVAIAVLLLWSLDSAMWALWNPVSRATKFLFTAVAILDIPYFTPALTGEDRITLFISFSYLLNSFVCMAAAWLLSRWVYGIGPLRCMSKYGPIVTRRNHV